MTAAPIHQDNTFHAARAKSDRNRHIPIVPAKGVVKPLPSPLEFDPRDPPRLVHVPAALKNFLGLVILSGLIAGLFALYAWSVPNVG